MCFRLTMLTDEEESMEVSGGETSPDVAQLLKATTLDNSSSAKRNRSSLHNFSFDVSWTTWDKPPTPPRNPFKTVHQLLSPAKFTTSSPVAKPWKTLNLRQEHESKPSPATVKVSQSPYKKPLGDLTNMDLHFSPFKTTDSYELNHNFSRPKPKLFSQFSNEPFSNEPDVYISSKEVNESLETNEESTSSIHGYNNNNEKFVVKEEISTEEMPVFETAKPIITQTKKSKKDKQSVKKQKESKRRSSGLILWLFVLGGVVGLGAYIYMQVNFCTEFHIDVKDLNKKLHDNVFGQHVAVKSVIDTVERFIEDLSADGSQTFVLSFHGWTGVGKNYISKFISEAFYNSRIFWYLVPLHFIHEDSGNHEINARQWILGNISRCGINVFIIDEMDKAGEGLINGVKAAIETLKSNVPDSDGLDPLPVTLFIFLSNAKASQINQYLVGQLNLGRDRKSIGSNEFQLLFSESDFEWYHELYIKDLIDVFVPFLPLEERHVRQCIIRDFRNKGKNPREYLVDRVLEELSFLDLHDKKFRLSLTGCKRVQDKVDLHVDE